MTESQTAAAVMMIRPVHFIGNPQTRATNRFQTLDDAVDAAAHRTAVAEFDALVIALRHAGVHVHVFDDTPEPHTPDSIFPNNWVSLHADGTAVLYPMMAENRRQERRQDVLEALSTVYGYRIRRVIDLTAHEQQGKFLEGTGSLVLDRVNRVAYACVSPRTDLDVLGDFGQQLDYEVVAFEALDRQGAPIYHTNVVMSVGARFAAVCLESVRADEREPLVGALRASGHEVIDLSWQQMHDFAGNILELRTTDGEPVVAMSQRARDSLTPQQRDRLKALAGRIVAVDIATIERLGGGSVRCMLAEVHLPQKTPA